MITYPDRAADGTLVGFEVESLYVGSGELGQLLISIPDVSSVRARSLFKDPSDVRLRFVYKGREFQVVEPFGDNSRYLICRVPGSTAFDISEIEETVRRHRVPRWRKLIADLATLQWGSLLKSE